MTARSNATIIVDSYWNIIKKDEFPYDVYINMSEFKIRKSITQKMKTYIKTTYVEPQSTDDLMTSAKCLRDILRIIHHHYRAGRSVVVFCYHGINRSASCKYAYHKYFLGEEIEYFPCNEFMYDVLKIYEKCFLKKNISKE